MCDLTQWLKAVGCWLLAVSHHPSAAEAERHQRITFRLAVEAATTAEVATEAARALTEQLAACRALLAVTMGERDQAQAALELAEQELRRLNVQQRERRDADRYWITRTVTPREVSRN